ncbi:unnamed protein product [Orchesella dallaii]|uniref:UDP-N-acetylglucosamine transferase subunit ALG14 n=1 Tax=Orchesella dallaii TaxID=48710 RepID=A0ABP1PUN1_9HEXA
MESVINNFKPVGQEILVLVQMVIILVLGIYFIVGAIMVLYCAVLFMKLCLNKVVRMLAGTWFPDDAFPTMFILGSGGHTTEMLQLLPSLSALYPRVYISANSDPLSLDKAMRFESSRSRGQMQQRNAKFLMTYRIREVGQSWISVVLSSGPYSFLHAAILVMREKPESIICNGPGICVPFCVAGFVLTKLRLLETKLVFVESICRVETLSTTGRILLQFVDLFFVQWEELKSQCLEIYPNANILYVGRLA